MSELSDYGYADTMDEVLLIAIHHLEEVRHASDERRQKVYLIMASLAVKTAMQLYLDWLKREGKPQ